MSFSSSEPTISGTMSFLDAMTYEGSDSTTHTFDLPSICIPAGETCASLETSVHDAVPDRSLR